VPLDARSQPIPDAAYYVLSVDWSMSGWGPAEGKANICVVPCDDLVEATRVARYVRSRPEQSHIAIFESKPRDAPNVLFSNLDGWKRAARRWEDEQP